MTSATLLKITFPDEKLINQQVKFTQIRYAGVTLPYSTVTVQNLTTGIIYTPKVYPTGAFVGLIELNHGKNEIVINATTPQGSKSETLIINRAEPIVTSPSKPLIIENVLKLPDKDMVISAGDILTARFKGSPGGIAHFKLAGVKKKIPMTELEPATAGELKDVRGIYVGHYVVQPGDIGAFAPVEFILESNGKKIKAQSEAKIKIIPSEIYSVGITTEETIFLIEPYISRPYTYIIPEETKVTIIGEYGDYYKVKFNKTIFLYVEKSKVKLLPKGTPPLKNTIYATTVSSETTNNRTKIYLSMSDKPLFIVEESFSPPALALTLSNTILDTGWLTQFAGQKNIKLVNFSVPEENTVKVIVYLSDEEHWGYDVYYEDKIGVVRLVFEIKHKPKLLLTSSKKESLSYPPLSKEEPISYPTLLKEEKERLKGLTVFIDPGHGGEEKGALGPTGLEEKEVNLDMSLSLGRYLEAAGAKVLFSRTTDTKLSWRERFSLAKKSYADIYLCMHNNSIPETCNPLDRQGASTFYNYLSGKKLSEIITKNLTEIGLIPHTALPYYVYRTPYHYSPTNMVFVLVEAAFISHPEDEMKLLDKDFRDKIGVAIYKSILEFVK